LNAATGAPKTSFGISSSGVQTFGGTADDYVECLCTTAAAVYVAGHFNSSSAKIGSAGPSISTTGAVENSYVLSLDAATGAANTAFGLSASGIQKFGGSTGRDQARGIVVNGTTLYVTGFFSSSTVQIGGTGPTVALSNGATDNAFVIALDSASGTAK